MSLTQDKHTIFSTDVCDEYEALRNDPEFEDESDDALWNMANDNVNLHMDDELGYNLDKDLKNEIVLIGTISRRNGCFSAFKFIDTKNIGDAIKKAMYSFDGSDNTFEAYTANGKTYLSQYGHDNPTNPSIIEFRMLNPDADGEELVSVEDIEKHSIPITPFVNEVYGWEVAA
jgi:hypothetical protein